jgi:hypothetical protein
MDPDAKLLHAITAFRELYANDGDWVKSGAAAHGVRVVTGDLTAELSHGNYNFHIPAGTKEEIAKIKTAKRVALLCEDYRQSEEAAHELNADVVIATAGGAGQPKPEQIMDGAYKQRAHVAAELLMAIHEINPDAVFILGFHTETCGGFKKLTNELNVYTYMTQGAKGELALMTDATLDLTHTLLDLGMPAGRVEVRGVILKHDEHPADHRFIKEIRPIILT